MSLNKIYITSLNRTVKYIENPSNKESYNFQSFGSLQFKRFRLVSPFYKFILHLQFYRDIKT